MRNSFFLLALQPKITYTQKVLSIQRQILSKSVPFSVNAAAIQYELFQHWALDRNGL